MRIKSILIISLSFLLSACHYADMGGMFITGESINERFEQSLAYNDNHTPKEIKVSTDDYNICSMGDSHIGGTHNFDLFQHLAKSMKTTAAVYVGDICNGNAENYDSLQKHMMNADSLTAFPIVGNHDLYFGGWKEFYSRFGSSTYYFSVKTPVASDLFICIDTGSGTLGSKQLSWFKNVLQNIRPQFRRCIVFTHNNLYRVRRTASTNPNEEELTLLTDYFLRYKVDMTIAGHDHLKNILKLGNTVHITMGALLDGFPSPDFLKITIKNGNLDYQFVDLY